VIALEHPELWGGLIDLEAAQELLQSAKQVLTEILQGKEAVQVAYRQGDRYLPRLVRLKEVAPEMQLSSESSYLISGGLGALGLQVAQRLVEQGVRHLVLLGRRGITNEVQQQAIVRLKTAGAQVQIVIVDVGNWTELGQAWTELQSSMPPVRGVIHAAGVLDDGLLQDQSWERFVKVMSPKVQGGWNLHRLTQDSELDFFVCFSSVAAMLGSVAQSNYAAANAFLDGLCEYRNSLGLPGVSLNWGPWSEVGMAADLSQALQTRLAQIGLKFIQPEQGLQVLEQQLGARGQLGVMAFDWDVFRRRLSARETEFFAAVLPPEAPERMKSSQQQQLAADLQQRLTADFQQRLATADEAERIDILRQTLQEEVARLLGLPAAEKTNPQTGFFELGMDSLMAMELRTRLTQLLCMDLPSTLIFDFPNIEKLEQYLNTQFIETTQYIQPSQASKLINVLKDLEEVEF
jgi:acyl carrier protein